MEPVEFVSQFADYIRELGIINYLVQPEEEINVDDLSIVKYLQSNEFGATIIRGTNNLFSEIISIDDETANVMSDYLSGLQEQFKKSFMDSFLFIINKGIIYGEFNNISNFNYKQYFNQFFLCVNFTDYLSIENIFFNLARLKKQNQIRISLMRNYNSIIEYYHKIDENLNNLMFSIFEETINEHGGEYDKLFMALGYFHQKLNCAIYNTNLPNDLDNSEELERRYSKFIIPALQLFEEMGFIESNQEVFEKFKKKPLNTMYI